MRGIRQGRGVGRVEVAGKKCMQYSGAGTGTAGAEECMQYCGAGTGTAGTAGAEECMEYSGAGTGTASAVPTCLPPLHLYLVAIIIEQQQLINRSNNTTADITNKIKAREHVQLQQTHKLLLPVTDANKTFCSTPPTNCWSTTTTTAGYSLLVQPMQQQ